MIRPFEKADMEETLRVFRSACITSHEFLKPEFIRLSEERMRHRTLLQFPTEVFDDGGIRAFVSRKDWYLDALFVDPPFQSRGIGKRFLDHLKAQNDFVQLSVFARNTRAIRFYQREEFWATKVDVHRETGETIVLLKWEGKRAA